MYEPLIMITLQVMCYKESDIIIKESQSVTFCLVKSQSDLYKTQCNDPYGRDGVTLAALGIRGYFYIYNHLF